MDGAELEVRPQRVIVLGSGPALASATRDNTYFVFDSDASSLLIDCAGSPFHRLLRVRLDPSLLSGVLLTHAHPDHVYGLASLVHEMWLDGRTEPLNIYANVHTERLALALLDVFDLRSKPLPLAFYLIPEEPGHLLMQNQRFEVRTAAVRHQVPTVAVRIDSLSSGKAVVFSSDTSPCPELVAL
ncbi:MAG: ribonuclease Z, partial [Anaerolineae bacterium]|nr:ribonuclease Z [Anaerolineae bacterium]